MSLPIDLGLGNGFGGLSLDLGATHGGAEELLSFNEELVVVGAAIGSIRDANKVIEVELKGSQEVEG